MGPETWFVIALSIFIALCVIWGVVMLHQAELNIIRDLTKTNTMLVEMLVRNDIDLNTGTKRGASLQRDSLSTDSVDAPQ